MLYGNVMIAFHKQDGTFCLEKGTLVGYEKFFHREFNLKRDAAERISLKMPTKAESDQT